MVSNIGEIVGMTLKKI